MVKTNFPELLSQDIERLRSVADMCLAPDHPTKLSDFERLLLSDAECNITPNLTTVLAALKGNDQALKALHKLIQCVEHIGPITVLTNSQEESWRPVIERKRADYMRAIRASSPEEIALMKAIGVEHPGEFSAQPTKDANAIIGDVNRRLIEQGFKAVKMDVIRRRLERLPRS